MGIVKVHCSYLTFTKTFGSSPRGLPGSDFLLLLKIFFPEKFCRVLLTDERMGQLVFETCIGLGKLNLRLLENVRA